MIVRFIKIDTKYTDTQKGTEYKPSPEEKLLWGIYGIPKHIEIYKTETVFKEMEIRRQYDWLALYRTKIDYDKMEVLP